ncbi:MAG: hypothetical protein MOB07_24225 [Acidobacteria bacterium]|nr:hypothetical protein [Acidobacteriota bacterium]
MPKLNQIVAIEKEVKSRTYGEVTTINKLLQKPDLFTGFSKQYRPDKDEDGETFPPDNKRVQLIAEEQLRHAARFLTEIWDVTATKDWANCRAQADVVVDGEVLIAKAPVPFLLFLEKQLNDLRTLVENLPTLDEADNWIKDDGTGLHKTEPIQTHKTKKMQKAIVLYHATPEHPAQTQLITEDLTVGYWHQVKHSGAMPTPRKKELLGRIEKLSHAVKFAREAANGADAERVRVSDELFGYLLA